MCYCGSWWIKLRSLLLRCIYCCLSHIPACPSSLLGIGISYRPSRKLLKDKQNGQEGLNSHLRPSLEGHLHPYWAPGLRGESSLVVCSGTSTGWFLELDRTIVALHLTIWICSRRCGSRDAALSTGPKEKCSLPWLQSVFQLSFPAPVSCVGQSVGGSQLPSGEEKWEISGSILGILFRIHPENDVCNVP